MVFSSPVFLFLFLPVVVCIYLLLTWFLPRYKNPFLCVVSLLFYTWGEKAFALLLVFSISVNYLVGIGISRSQKKGASGKKYMAIAIAANLALLFFFKYANFIVNNLNHVFRLVGLSSIELDSVHLPIGISFFTFQALSYVVDVYRRDAESQRNPLNVALYISLFPQLIAGPIVRYRDIQAQIYNRTMTFPLFHSGVRRFIIGLGKKVLIANNLAEIVDYTFALHQDNLTTGIAWLAMVCYSLQIYFDFSGYSDMAIGLGRLFGFKFLENFNYPYIANSFRDFWRRWHISLSTWFRDYVYISLGGNRRGKMRTLLNLFLVFFLCGLWHGANWTFVLWGGYHGFFLVLERSRLQSFMEKWPNVLRIVYTFFFVTVGWVFFRSNDMEQALVFLKAMFGQNSGAWVDPYLLVKLNNEVLFFLALGLIFMTPIVPTVRRFLLRYREAYADSSGPVLNVLETVFMFGILVWCSAKLASDSYDPFIYFQF